MSPITLKVAIAENSLMIRMGLDLILKKLTGFRISTLEISSFDKVKESVDSFRPDLLIINPNLLGNADLLSIYPADSEEMRCMALVTSILDPVRLRGFDDQISVFDSSDEIRHRLERLKSSKTEEADDEQQALSQREKEIVVCVVKGMTNREIAENLFLSAHTVITHRRNIARKLQIHSASGLTVYAIVNKLVELNDLKL